MPTLARLIAVMVGLLLVVGAAVFLFLRSPVASDGLHRMATAVGLDAAPPERHVVPENFHGWVVVHFAVEGAPPLREEDGALIIEYPASGRLDTSTPAPEGEGLLQRGYYRKTPMVWRRCRGPPTSGANSAIAISTRRGARDPAAPPVSLSAR